MRVGCLLVIATFTCFSVKGQQDPQFSQYMSNVSYWSPSFTGAEGVASIYLLSRSQWVGYSGSFDQTGGAPSTQYINYSMPLDVLNTPLSVGATIIYDQLGPSSSIQLHLPVAHHFEFPRGTLSVGLRPVLNNAVVDFGQLDFLNPTEERGTKESQFLFDLDAGVSYSTENYRIGLGVHHLLTPQLNYGLADRNGTSQPVQLLYNLYGEYNYQISYRLSLSPSILVQTDINTYSVNAGAIATYAGKISGGISYRYSESIVFIFGYSFFENNALRVGYSFDYVINDQEVKSQTSHEIYVRYNLPKFDSGSKKIIRTPRFRF